MKTVVVLAQKGGGGKKTLALHWAGEAEAERGRAAIVLNACPARSPAIEQARTALEAYELPLCPTPVMQRVALAYALIDGRAVSEFEPAGKAAEEIRDTWKWIASVCEQGNQMLSCYGDSKVARTGSENKWQRHQA